MKKSPAFSDKLQSSHREQDSINGGLRKNHQNSSSALKYIRAAAKNVVGILTLSFLFKPRKFTQKGINNGQIRGVSSSIDLSTGSCNRSSSRFDSFTSYCTAANGLDGTPNFSYEEIFKATQKFSPANIVGEGGFGAVYRARLEDGTLVAVKRAKKNTHDKVLSSEFRNEIITLSLIEHLNLVRLYGYLEHGEERIIVVEFVGNGTLREHLDGTRGNGLEFAERLDIAIDVAHAVTYLHMYSDPPIIHRDIKSSNILITEKLRAKVADFGFARRAADQEVHATHISTQVKGTAGYLDPEYLRTYQLTEKSDVYSFGVLLVELMTGRLPIETKKPSTERLTIRWAMQKLKGGHSVHVMDPRLRRTPASTMAAEKILKLAHQCLSSLRNSRPSMKKCGEVLWEIRKDFREKAFPPHPTSTSHHSANFPWPDPMKSRHITVGIDDEDDKFISA